MGEHMASMRMYVKEAHLTDVTLLLFPKKAHKNKNQKTEKDILTASTE